MKNKEHEVFFNTRDELTKVCLDDVMYAISDGNYITVKFKSGRTLTLLASLQNFLLVTEAIPNVQFARIGRSHVINMAYVSQVNTLRKTIVLVDDDMGMTIELIVPKEAIRQLKQTFTDSPRIDIPDFETTNGNMEAWVQVPSSEGS